MPRKKLLLTTVVGAFVLLLGPLAWNNFSDYRIGKQVQGMSNLQLHNEVERLNRRIYPTKGTTLEEVEAVYGKSGVCGIGKGDDEPDPNCHSIILLSYLTDKSYGAELTVYTRKNQKTYSSIFHGNSIGGMKQISLGLRPPLPMDKEAIIEREKKAQEALYASERHNNMLALKNLIIIDRMYSRSLDRAPWNQQS